MGQPRALVFDDGPARLSVELHRLDPFTFWVVPAGARSSADMIVVGTTGVFFVASLPAPGAFSIERGRPTLDRKAIPGMRALRSDAKALSAKLSGASVFAKVEPVVCLTQASIGMPRDAKGVRFVGLGELVGDLTSRPRTLPLPRVQRAARALGVQIAGDAQRRFV